MLDEGQRPATGTSLQTSSSIATPRTGITTSLPRPSRDPAIQQGAPALVDPLQQVGNHGRSNVDALFMSTSDESTPDADVRTWVSGTGR
jgi:hypothetical protein